MSTRAPTVLERILAETRDELERRKRELPLQALASERHPVRPAGRPFAESLRGEGMGVIAEFKRRSPSAGSLRSAADLAEVIAAYARGGAVAVSVLTEGPNFGGELADLMPRGPSASCRCCARTSSSTPISCMRRAPRAPTPCC